MSKKSVFRVNNTQKGCILATFWSRLKPALSGSFQHLRDSKPLLAKAGSFWPKEAKSRLRKASSPALTGRLGTPSPVGVFPAKSSTAVKRRQESAQKSTFLRLLTDQACPLVGLSRLFPTV